MVVVITCFYYLVLTRLFLFLTDYHPEKFKI